MDATPSLREQGMQALQQGQIDQAIDLLARAVMADDRDADAKAILGVAYSQKGLHAQAKRALQTAVELQPQNPSFRYNLGIVLERGGEMQGAAIAYRDTLQINKDHAQARAKLQAMGPQAHAFLANAPRPPAPEQFGGAPPPMHASGLPPTAPGPPAGGPAPAMGQPPGYAHPSMPAPPPIMQPGFGGPGLAHHGGPPGTVQCPNCREFSRPGLSCEFCSASLKPPSPTQAVGPPVGGPMAVPGYSPGAMQLEDDFNVGQGFADWVRVLISPRAVMEEQARRGGVKGGAAFVMAFSIVWALTNVVVQQVTMGFSGPRAIGGVTCGWICVFALFMAPMFVWAGIVHLASKMFGGASDYAGSFRASAYASAPALTLTLIGMLVSSFMLPKDIQRGSPRGIRGAAPAPALLASNARPTLLLAQVGSPRGVPGFPGGPGGSGAPGGFPGAGGPSGGDQSKAAMELLTQIMSAFLPAVILVTVGYWWSAVVLGIGLAHIHGLSTGRAIGAVAVAVILSNVISGLLFFGLAAAIMGLIASAMQAAGR